MTPDPQLTDEQTLDDDAREERRQQEAKEILRRSFEHGAPETGPGDDLSFEPPRKPS
jgi:hypothetical protein